MLAFTEGIEVKIPWIIQKSEIEWFCLCQGAAHIIQNPLLFSCLTDFLT